MSWLRSHQRASWICGLTLLVPLILYLYALFGLLAVRQEYRSDIDRLEFRTARLQGLVEQQESLESASESATGLSAELVYPASNDSAGISASLQTGLREILSEAGLTVTNSQVLPVREQESFQYVGLRLTVRGGMDGLDAALLALAEYRPVVLIESLNVKPVSTSRKQKAGGQKITVTMQVLSLRALQ
jgi:general secretion pathway protein M